VPTWRAASACRVSTSFTWYSKCSRDNTAKRSSSPPRNARLRQATPRVMPSETKSQLLHYKADKCESQWAWTLGTRSTWLTNATKSVHK
jgi:hypothetical protein